jgi:mutator protein MutT
MPSAIAAVAVARLAAPGCPEWLVAQRLPGATLAGLWEWPGGKVEPGETKPQAAARELFEEVGLRVPATDLRAVGGALNAGPITLELFWTMAPHHASPQPLGCAQVRWVDASELAHLEFPPANASLTHRIVAIDRMLRAGSPPTDPPTLDGGRTGTG